MSENGNHDARDAAGGEDDLKRKLVRRVAFAGMLIAALLGVLAFIDYLGSPAEEPDAGGPTYTSPVPVPKKEVSQPVKPAEPMPAEPAKPVEAAKPAEATAAPVADAPAKPEVAAQPSLPVAATKQAAAVKPAARSLDTPAEGTAPVSSQQFFPPAEKTGAPALKPAEPVPATTASPQPPAPPRLFSGYAVQAGVFADAQHAEELRAKLALNGIPSSLEARVQVGPFKSREEAEAARQKMKALGIDGVLLPPRNAKK